MEAAGAVEEAVEEGEEEVVELDFMATAFTRQNIIDPLIEQADWLSKGVIMNLKMTELKLECTLGV